MIDQAKICEGVSDLSDSYQGFLIDQWGTLHDGEKLFPETLETLQNLKSRGKQIILISNSGKRAKDDQTRLENMGLDSSLYDHIVTSAEVAWQSLSHRDSGLCKGLGEKCFLLNRHGDASIVENVDDLQIVDDIEVADFILLTGSDAPEKTLENYYDEILKKASRKRLKMICANPEKTITIDGKNYMGSGDISMRYEEFGGVVNYIGKPFPAIFNHALSLFKGLYQSQICVIGDSLANDIRGAKYLDIDSVLVANGLHKNSFSKVQSTSDIHKMLKMLNKTFGVEPTCFIPKFHWGKQLPDRKNKKKQK